MRLSSLAALCLATAVVTFAASPSSAADWELVWSDEFDGTTLDTSKWDPQIGTGCPTLCGWGNNELQYYRSENATVSGGMLTIEAREESFGGMQYTSARLRTLGKADWLYGRFEMRAKLPVGKGLWPAFWMLPSDSEYGVWAASGEIDIMEITGDRPDKLHGTIHHGATWPDNTSSGQTTTLPSGSFGDDFHVFAIEWEPTEIRWYLDGKLYATQTDWYSVGNPFPAPFDKPFHLLLNVAVGGYFPGNPDASTVFPQQMVVDYVRVYEDATSCEVVYDSMDHAAPFDNGWFQFSGSAGGGGIGGNLAEVAPGVGSNASISAGYGSGGAPGFVGGFGRSRALDLGDATHFEMWIKPNPGSAYAVELNIQDDDNGDGVISLGPDDEFQYVLQVGGEGAEVSDTGGWQRVAIPLSAFADDNSYWNGGNGVLDTAVDGNGMMVSFVTALIHQSGPETAFLTDRWAFTRRTGSIAGRIWSDANGNGIQDAGEGGFEGVPVFLVVDGEGIVETAETGPDGNYEFTALPTGDFTVIASAVGLPEGLVPTYDPDGTATASTFQAVVACDATTGGDFGYRSAATNSPSAVTNRDRLYGARPNPFNAQTAVRFDLAAAGSIELAIFDTQGRLVRTLESGRWEAGSHQSIWDGTDKSGSIVASGVYFAALKTSRTREVQRMVLVK
jgi:beta-glucanase (GH16 family)